MSNRRISRQSRSSISSSRYSNARRSMVGSGAGASFMARTGLLSDIAADEAYSFALRGAFLHYLLQPRKKRKEYIAAAPKPRPRAMTSSKMSDTLKDLVLLTSSSSSVNMQLPRSFQANLRKRMEGVVVGTEHLPGFGDAPTKRSFAEAYTIFTDADKIKTLEKDRKIEPLVLTFVAAANKAQAKLAQAAGKADDDDSWKALADRHTALFVRLISSVLRAHGHDQGRPEMMAQLATLEKKLLSNDQDLYLDTGQKKDGEPRSIEVEVPLSYDVKDMPMVQTVARLFARPLPDVQLDIDRDLALWTEEAALQDLKNYQHRLAASMPGTLRRQDFALDDAYDEWRKTEVHQLTQKMLDILTVRPQLAKTTATGGGGTATGGAGGAGGGGGKPLPSRPTSFYSSFGGGMPDLSGDPAAALAALSLGEPGLDGLGDTGSPGDDLPDYTFIPPDPRAYFRFVLRQAMTHDLQHPEDGDAARVVSAVPLLQPSLDLLAELAAHWRLTQGSRLMLLLDVAVQQYLDLAIPAEAAYEIFEDVKTAAKFDTLPHGRKPPHIQHYGVPLDQLERHRWLFVDGLLYQHLLGRMHEGMLRELLEIACQCYEAKPPSIGPTLLFIEDHIQAVDQKPEGGEQGGEQAGQDGRLLPGRLEAEAQFAAALTAALRDRAAGVYRGFLDDHVPHGEEEWDFGHVVELGKAVVGVCKRVSKRYRRKPEILGVSPFRELATTVLPSFEEDAQAIIERVMAVAKARGLEVNMQDGFDLYGELVEIRQMHETMLPAGQPFAFSVEGLLEEFVWRWIRGAQERMEAIVEEAIKQDDFQIAGQEQQKGKDRHSVSIVDTFQAFSQSVQQVQQLQWQDAVHVAKFMTALSSAFTAAIGRYCDLVEQQFAREMDRPSAQELANTNKTTQERWMQYAKEALSSKEKVEPFQFYRESFVKLNNIEYAMQALDKLEKTVDVDHWADVLRQAHGSPKPVDRRHAKYVFTIKIVEAEDLKACDPTGTSDPYVVLCDEYQKRLAKTRIVMRNLHPRWDESVEITVTGPLNIIATIWDYDTFGDHDFVGRTSLKLDPLHFGDFLPREFWLDLDTQGRLLLRVSMEGERDDIQFYFAKAFRHLKRTERDMVRKVTDKLVAHINASLSYEAVRSVLSGMGLLGSSIQNISGRGLASMAALWQKRTSLAGGGAAREADGGPLAGGGGSGGSGGGAGGAGNGGAGGGGSLQVEAEKALASLFTYFDENFAIMKQTLTDATMLAVMTRLWKEVLMAIEALLVPPVSDKPSIQKPLSQAELDVVYRWLELLFGFFHARDDETGDILGVPADVLKSPKYHELASLNFFYFDSTESLVRTSERMAAANVQRAQQQQQQAQHQQLQSRPMSAPPGFPGAPSAMHASFASMGTIRRGKSIMMSRNLGTMRKAKEERRREAQADPSDDMILRILRMRPEAAGYLKERYRQKERMAAHQAAAMIVRQSINQGWSGPAFGGATYSRTVPR